MSEPADDALKALKSFAGIIHRQPLFDHELNVNGYYLSFLDNQGRPLADDELPDFAAHLSQILEAISQGKQLVLDIPPHWQNSLQASADDIILMSNGHLPATTDAPFKRAAYLADESSDCHTLLVDVQQAAKDTLSLLTQHQQTVCAVNVDSPEDFQWCINNKIPQMTGQFYTRPNLPQAHKTQPSQQMLLQLLVELHDPDADAETLAKIINQDVTLSYKLLKLVNSAFFGLPREIRNTQQAIVMLGQNKIKTWASLLCLSGVDDKPSELRRIAMQRARMSELLARYYKGQQESFFICGLLSTLDALLDKPLTEIIQGLPLHPDIELALTDYQGAAGAALRDTIAYERAQWSTLDRSPVPKEVLVSTYLDAMVWTSELDQQLQD